MAILKIARMGHPVLLKPAEPVDDPTAPEIRRLVEDMMETMEDAGGVGLAAPQVHVPLRLFVFRVPAERTTEPDDEPIGNSVLINPQLTPVGEETQAGWEGCLSIPGMMAEVTRPGRIRYSGLDASGARVEREVAGWHARIVQHENDHLNGVLYTMRLTDFGRFGYQEEVARWLRTPPAG